MKLFRLTRLTTALLTILVALSCALAQSPANGKSKLIAISRTSHIPIAHVPGRIKSKSSRYHHVTQYEGRHKKVVAVKRHRGRYHAPAHARGRRHRRHVVATPKVRHAYPMNFFMLKPPAFDTSSLSSELTQKVREAFDNGSAGQYPPRALVRAGIVSYHPLHGGIFWRREPVKYIIMHSTETGVPQDAPHVINSWSSGGRRHAGAQYVVDRDGSIYQSVDPDLATVHVNIFKTLPGINNDNTVGIEMVHAGKQTYTPEQRSSVIRLVSYLQAKYHVGNDHVITHRYAQQGDHTDPVAFDWDGFISKKDEFRQHAIARNLEQLATESNEWGNSHPVASTYLQIEGPLPTLSTAAGKKTTDTGFKPAANLPARGESPALRGPMELDPNTASLLNSTLQSTTPGSSSNARANQAKPSSGDASAVNSVKPAPDSSQPEVKNGQDQAEEGDLNFFIP